MMGSSRSNKRGRYSYRCQHCGSHRAVGWPIGRAAGEPMPVRAAREQGRFVWAQADRGDRPDTKFEVARLSEQPNRTARTSTSGLWTGTVGRASLSICS